MRLKRLAAFVLFLCLLAPSAWYAWQNRDIPQLGRGHDDAIYLTVAQSVAQGTGYRILNLPGTPPESKYPPVLIWLLSFVWLVDPRFPQNLSLATALQWSMIPPFLYLCLLWFQRAGLTTVWRWVGLAVLATSPYTVSFGAGIFTEVLFAGLLLTALLVCERVHAEQVPARFSPALLCAAAGVFAGIAYLTRTAGIAALLSVPAVLFLWGKRREAGVFFATMLPFVLGWMTWAKLHQTPASDLATLYNTDYFGFLLRELSLSDLGVMIWKNLGHLLYAAGGLALPLDIDLPFWPILRVTVAIGMLRGIYSHRANRAVQLYAAFAVVTVAELVVWNFPPNLRLMYTLVPLLVAGLLWEAEHLIAMLRGAFAHKDSSQRVAAWGIASLATLFCIGALWMQAYMTFTALPAQAAEERKVRAENRAAFQWLAEHSATGDNILAVNPALYLYAGRHTQTLVSLPIYWYRDDTEHMLNPFRELPQGSSKPMAFLYLHDNDYDQLAPGAGEAARKMVGANPNLTQAFRSGRGTVYQVTLPTSAENR